MSKRKNPFGNSEELPQNDSEQDPSDADTKEFQVEEIAAVQEVSQTVTVRAINLEVRHGRMLVYDVTNTANAWLVPVEHLRLSTKEQVVPQNILDASTRAYSWDNELQALVVSLDEVRLGLYYLGYYEAVEINVRQVVAELLRVGRLPITK